MDRRLLGHYQRELAFIRKTAGEFAAAFPKIAQRLALTEFECADPYVERLLEGFAFLSARVQLKLEAEFPRFTQSLLQTVYPHYLAPTPSMAVVQFQPELGEAGLAEGVTLPRGTVLRSLIGKGEQTRCEYRTAHPVTLWPLQIVEAQYHTRDLGVLSLPSRLGARAALRLRLQATAGLAFKAIKLDVLNLYLHGSDETPRRLYEQFLAHGIGTVIQPITRPPRWQEIARGRVIRPVGYEESQALLPYDARSFQGYRLLHEYFACPQRYLFVDVTGLAPGLRRAEERQLDLLILFDQADLALENAVTPSHLALGCTPAINLFPKRADRIHLSERFAEFHVVPDRTRPKDFEVYEVLGVTAYGPRADDQQQFLPFYSARDFEADGGGHGAYFAVYREPRLPSSREKRLGRRTLSYGGSEVYIALVDAKGAPYRTDLKQLGVDTLCTNRDLPIHMPVGIGRTDFSIDSSAPVESIRCLAGPTPPRPSHAEGEVAWRAISHLALNYLSLADTDEHQGAAALRDLLRLYADTAQADLRKQVEGVRHVYSRPVTRRVPTHGPITFARGLEVTVELDEAAFEGVGVFLLGAVLAHFFAKYVTVNSFAETVVRSADRGEVMRWDPKIGQRPML